MEKANATDLVIDLDRIAVAISGRGSPSHGHKGAIDYTAAAARNAAITEILERKHYLDTDVYLVHSNPGDSALGLYAFHNAEMVVIDPGREVVEARVKDERPPESMNGVRKFYDGRQARSSRAWT
jgi:hypothetical protein